jgi:hypothetical protein
MYIHNIVYYNTNNTIYDAVFRWNFEFLYFVVLYRVFVYLFTSMILKKIICKAYDLE